MEFLELIKKRYSVRAYKADPVEQEKIDKILEAANLAPTAANRQPFKILVIHTENRKEEMKQIYRRDWFSQAPIVLGICSIPDKAWVRRDGKNYADIDATIVMDHIILAATDLGLGTCWIGAFDPDAAKRILKLEEGWEPIAFTPLGYPEAQEVKKVRKNLNELVITIK